MVFPPDFQLEEMKEREYYEKIILPDEREFLLDEARAHMVVFAAGSVEGDRVEIMQDGIAVVEEEERTEAIKATEGHAGTEE